MCVKNVLCLHPQNLVYDFTKEATSLPLLNDPKLNATTLNELSCSDSTLDTTKSISKVNKPSTSKPASKQNQKSLLHKTATITHNQGQLLHKTTKSTHKAEKKPRLIWTEKKRSILSSIIVAKKTPITDIRPLSPFWEKVTQSYNTSAKQELTSEQVYSCYYKYIRKEIDTLHLKKTSLQIETTESSTSSISHKENQEKPLNTLKPTTLEDEKKTPAFSYDQKLSTGLHNTFSFSESIDQPLVNYPTPDLDVSEVGEPPVWKLAPLTLSKRNQSGPTDKTTETTTDTAEKKSRLGWTKKKDSYSLFYYSG